MLEFSDGHIHVQKMLQEQGTLKDLVFKLVLLQLQRTKPGTGHLYVYKYKSSLHCR
jgi:hypothetical protein